MTRSENKRSAFTLIGMILLTFLGQVLALYKSHFTAVTFGATNYMDAYNYALNIASFVFAFITTGITTVIVPAYVKKKPAEAVNTFITVIFGITFLVVLLVFAGRIPIISLLTKKDTVFVETTGNFLFIAFLIQAITAFLAVTTAYFQCINHYVIPKAVVLISNLMVTVVLLLGWVKDIRMYLFLLMAGAFMNLLLDLFIAIRLGFRYKPTLQLKMPEFIDMMYIFIPTLISSGVYRIHTFVDTTIAAGLSEGQLTILSYSTQVMSLVNGIIVGNLTVYAYPKIVARLSKEDHQQYFWDYTVLFHAVVCILFACFVTGGKEALSFLFSGGKFTAEDTNILYLCTVIYFFGQQFNIIRDLIYRYFYANGNTKTTLQNSVMVSVTNIILSLILVRFIGLYGIVLGTILSSFISLSRITMQFHKQYVIQLSFLSILKEYGKNIIAFIVAIGCVWLLQPYLQMHHAFILMMVKVTITLAVYVVMILLMKTRVRKMKL